MKLVGSFFEFDISELHRVNLGISNLENHEYTLVSISEGVLVGSRISVHYNNPDFYEKAYIRGFFYPKEMMFLGWVYYRRNNLEVKDDIRGMYTQGDAGIYIYGTWTYEDRPYGFVMDLQYS